MRIAATTYTPYVQRNRNNQPSFNGIPKNFTRGIMEYMNKGYENLPPMGPIQRQLIWMLPTASVSATIGVFATCTKICHVIGMCLGKY